MEFERACKTHYKSAPTVTPGIHRTITLSGLKIADYNTQKENLIRKEIHLLSWLQYPEWEHNQEKNYITSPIIARKPHYCFKPQHNINCFQFVTQFPSSGHSFIGKRPPNLKYDFHRGCSSEQETGG